MTQERIDDASTGTLTQIVARIKEIEARATPAPWDLHAPDCCGWIDYYDGVIACVKDNTSDLQDATGHAPTPAVARANQELIVALRNAWPAIEAALTSATERAEAARALLREWLATELDPMDEEYAPWIEQFTARAKAIT